LTGKYNDGVKPEGSRYEKHGDFLKDTWNKYFSEEKKEQSSKMLKALDALAKEHGFTQA
jgi:aryl-alcohol dehydrogenase-like predicted oxidoreductase